MPVVTVKIPAGQVERLRGELVDLYGIEAESVYRAVKSCLCDGEPLESPLAHREELLEFDRLLAQVGWASLSVATDDVELSGERRLLSSALYGVLIDLGESVAESCHGCWRGECTIDELCRPVRGLLELLSLLDGLDRPDRRTPPPDGDAGERSD